MWLNRTLYALVSACFFNAFVISAFNADLSEIPIVVSCNRPFILTYDLSCIYVHLWFTCKFGVQINNC